MPGPPKSTKTPEERLEEGCMPIPECGCWLWINACTHGYGVIKISGVLYRTHRLSWVLHKGPIPDGLSVLHKCDTRPCFNPDHLFLGTQTDNHADMMAKNRNPKGTSCGHAKLTESDIPKIRADTRSDLEIANDYGVTKSLISQVQRGKIWRHVA